VHKQIFHHISQGNHKLPQNTLIFNLSSATHCPAHTLGLCRLGHRDCYAWQIEAFRPRILSYLNRQKELWLAACATDFVAAVHLKVQISLAPVSYMRFNVSGDFHSNDCIVKMSDIADELFSRYNIITYTYTARPDLDWRKASPRLHINGQFFMPSAPSANCIEICYSRERFNSMQYQCLANCHVCDMCKTGTGRVIAMPLHGWTKMK
jgi:hypothetical protein